jgi:hypothetical protein
MSIPTHAHPADRIATLRQLLGNLEESTHHLEHLRKSKHWCHVSSERREAIEAVCKSITAVHDVLDELMLNART